jgi:hypothetical protein
MVIGKGGECTKVLGLGSRESKMGKRHNAALEALFPVASVEMKNGKYDYTPFQLSMALCLITINGSKLRERSPDKGEVGVSTFPTAKVHGKTSGRTSS